MGSKEVLHLSPVCCMQCLKALPVHVHNIHIQCLLQKLVELKKKSARSQLLATPQEAPSVCLEDCQTCLTRRPVPGRGPPAAGPCRKAPGSLQ